MRLWNSSRYEGFDGDAIPLTQSSVGGIIHHGGTILRTARSERFKRSEGVTEGLTRLKGMDVDALVVIGGEGSFKGAWELEKRGLPTVGIPGTIDNDCAGTDETIGYDTAVNTALRLSKIARHGEQPRSALRHRSDGTKLGFIALQVPLQWC